MTSYKLLILILVIGSATYAFGQQAKQKNADDLYNTFQYVDATKAYKELIAIDYETESNIRKLADSYHAMRDPENAVTYYAEVVKQEGISPEYYFKYAQNLRGVRRYDESKVWLQKYSDAAEIDSEIASEILKTDSIPKYTKLKYSNLRGVDFNSIYSDFGTYVRNNVVYYASSRLDNRETTETLYGWNEEPFLNIYTAYKSKDNADFILRSKVRPLKGNVNSKFHDGPMVLSPDGKTLYFTRNNIIGNKVGEEDEENTNNLKIYRSKKVGDSWEKVEELHFNSNDYSCRAPAISEDGKTLYFSSNMPGTIGGTDLYKASISDHGTIGEPINLGNKINTERDESFPHISNNRLFFASNGHKGYGLFDVFVSEIEDGENFSQVLNLGPIINTNADDFSFFLVSKKENDISGYVSSNREGGVGSDDIYQFDIKQPEKVCTVVLKGQIIDAANGRPVPNAAIRLLDENGKQIDFVTADENGYYMTQAVACNKEYPMEVRSVIHQPKETVAYLYANEPNSVVTQNVQLDPIEDVEYLAALKIIYFDFDKYIIRPDAAEELDKLANLMLNIYPDLIVKIGSHTDKRGSNTYNERLAINRANSTYEYLLKKGISSHRILAYKGFGENQPVIHCPNNDCNEVEHQLNRRSVFEVVRMK